jgi:hypothetical protein
MVHFSRAFAIGLLLSACGSVNKVDDNPVDGGTEDAGADARPDAPPDALQPRHIVFVSSVTFPADLGSRDQYTAECQTLADSAGLSGEFVALLHVRSDPLDPDDIAIQGPVFNMAGDLVAIDQAEFYSGTFQAGNGTTESGGSPADTVAWVGTPEGTIATCGDWGSTASSGGQVNVTDLTWLTSNSAGPCTLNRSIQCISL